jgi:hypothetical protein
VARHGAAPQKWQPGACKSGRHDGIGEGMSIAAQIL